MNRKSTHSQMPMPLPAVVFQVNPTKDLLQRHHTEQFIQFWLSKRRAMKRGSEGWNISSNGDRLREFALLSLEKKRYCGELTTPSHT